ncbi:unnamed protein product [Phytomonas sp. EM1]|nr:unnamed protein product [Phytomonas sp. EM1]|eukprot:CCW59993.1 unnamed protein product [Phytomonas sp. isolate EM1]
MFHSSLTLINVAAVSLRRKQTNKLAMTNASFSGKKKASAVKYLLEKEEDEIVCSFGSDYFAGARCGSGGGGLLCGSFSLYQFRLIKRDHMEANLAVGLKFGERNPNFSRWTLLRGISSQPMMTVGCIALMTTTFLKSVKFYLANCRCREFARDDAEYFMLQELSMQDPVAYDAFVKLFVPKEDDRMMDYKKLGSPAESSHASFSPSLSGTPTQTGTVATNPPKSTAASHYKSMEELYKIRKGSTFVKKRRPPTFMDGVAVGLMGSIMDCYLPQKPIQNYYGMRCGMG